MEDSDLQELYRQYGEIMIRLEYFQARQMEIRAKIAKALEDKK